MVEGYQCEFGLLPLKAIDIPRLIGRPAIVTWFALLKLRPINSVLVTRDDKPGLRLPFSCPVCLVYVRWTITLSISD